MKRRSWPDLALRAKIVKNWPGKKQGWSQPASPPPGTSNVVDAIIALVKKAALETAGTEGEMTEDEYVVHLKDCVTCRRNVASLARMGVKIPSRVLVAAGVEVLN